MTNKPNLSDRPNGSLSVRLSYEVEMGGLEPIHKLERERNLVGEVADLERRLEAATRESRLEWKRARIRARGMELWKRMFYFEWQTGRYLGGDHSRTPSAIAHSTEEAQG